MTWSEPVSPFFKTRLTWFYQLLKLGHGFSSLDFSVILSEQEPWRELALFRAVILSSQPQVTHWCCVYYCYRLLEEGGTVFTFEGIQKKCPLSVVLKIHSPQFYWKVIKKISSNTKDKRRRGTWPILRFVDQVMTEADLGLADSYINGDFSFVDKHQGLLNLFQVI